MNRDVVDRAELIAGAINRGDVVGVIKLWEIVVDVVVVDEDGLMDWTKHHQPSASNNPFETLIFRVLRADLHKLFGIR